MILNLYQAFAVCKPNLSSTRTGMLRVHSSPCEPYLEISTDVCNSLIHLIAATEEMHITMTILPNNLCNTGRRISCTVRKMLCHITTQFRIVPAKSLCLVYGWRMLSGGWVEPKTPRTFCPLGALDVCVLISPFISRNGDNIRFCVSSSTTLSQTGPWNVKHLYFVSKYDSL